MHIFKSDTSQTTRSKLMSSKPCGFSLIEILVSLVIVSLTAVNITGLQNKISQQQRDNISHAAVLSIATEKMEEALSLGTIDELIARNNISETVINDTIGELTIKWQVTDVEEINSLVDNFKQITLTISWIGQAAQTQTFTYSSQVNFGTLLSTASTLEDVTDIEQRSSIIVSALNNKEVIYFETNTSYQAGSFVIFDSYLYQATKDYLVGDELPHFARNSESGILEQGEGWQSFGSINNPELANIEGLATIF